MTGRTALQSAIELLALPSQVGHLRAQALPHDLGVLLCVASGEAQVTAEAARGHNRAPEVIHQAAIFYLEQVLFAPDTDSYRVLGASPSASSDELRRNMKLLLKWLHPDVQRGDPTRSIFARRVTAAWNDLKTPERRSAYDATLARVVSPPSGRGEAAQKFRRRTRSPRRMPLLSDHRRGGFTPAASEEKGLKAVLKSLLSVFLPSR